MKVLHKIIGYIFVITLVMVVFMGFVASIAMEDLKENTTAESSEKLIDQEKRKLESLVLDKAELNEVFVEKMISLTRMMSGSISGIIHNQIFISEIDDHIELEGYHFIQGEYEGSFSGALSGTLNCTLDGRIGDIGGFRSGEYGFVDDITTSFLTGKINGTIEGTMILPDDTTFEGTYNGQEVAWSNGEFSVNGAISGFFHGEEQERDSGCGFKGGFSGSLDGMITGGMNADLSGRCDLQCIAALKGEFNGTSNSSPQIIENMLVSIDDNDPLIDSAYIGVSKSWNSLNEAGSIFTSPSYGYFGYNPTKRDWYLEVIDRQETYVTEPYVDATGLGRLMTISSPIIVNGSIIGAAAVDVTIKNVIESMLTIKSYESATSFLVDSEGELIASEQMKIGDPKWFIDIEPEDLKEIDDPGFQDILDKVLDGRVGVEKYEIKEKVDSDPIVSDLFLSETDGKGKSTYLAYAPINSTGWRMIISVDEEEILSPATQVSEAIDEEAGRETRRFLVFSLIILLLSLGVGSVIGYELLRPLEELTKEMENVSVPENKAFSERIDRNDEVGMLTRAFDDMNERLSRSMGALEFEIEERKRKEEEVSEERERAEFYLDLLGHDIGNLHQSIYASLQIAEIKKKDPAVREKALKLAGENIRRSMTLIRNINMLARVSSRKENLEEIDVVSLVKKAVMDMQSMFPTKTIKIKFVVSDDEIDIMAEPIADTIFVNLLHNSVKFQTDEEATLRINIVKDMKKKIARISISDHGQGIPDELKKDIFNRFNRGKEWSKKGTGLGLHIVKIMVDRYGGSLRVEDRIKGDHGEGTKFVIELPLAPSSQDL